MPFHAVEPKIPMLLVSFLILFLFISNKESIFLILAIICIIGMNIKYRFEIKDNIMFFTASIFGVEILNRETSNENIKWIELKRTNWSTKSVFIRLKKGIRWKLSRFNPNNIDEHIENYANSHSIALKKEKYY